MTPIEHIRRNVLKATQTEFAAIAGVKQATVSRWEAGEFKPRQGEMEQIRAEALARGLEWDDRWFFDAPPTAPDAPAPESAKVS